MAEGIDHLLRVFGNILQSREALMAPKIQLAFLEFDKQFSVRYYQYDSDTKYVTDLGTEPFAESEVRKLHVFCAFPSLKQDELLISRKGELFYARPLSLWLAPVAFLLVPAGSEAATEAHLSEYDTLLQTTLSDALWRAVDDAFTPTAIGGLPDDAFQALFSSAISRAIMPRQWTYQEQLHDFSSQLFSSKAQLELLQISLSNGFPIQFDVPLAIKKSASNTALNWAYLPQRLNQQKAILTGKIEQLYKRLIQRRVEVDNLVKMSDFPEKIEAARHTITQLGDDLGEIEKQLGQSEDHVKRLLQATPFSVQSVNQFYPISNGKYKVAFENSDINVMGRQVSRILYTLLSYPGRSFDMYLLYANTQNLKLSKPKTSSKSEEDNHRQMMIKYLNEELIQHKELEKAKETGDLRYYTNRLKQGIQLLEKCVKSYPEWELGSVLQDYQFYYEEYWDEGLVEDSFGAPVLQDIMLVSKRTARERIAKQLSPLYNELDRNGQEAFRKYLQDVIIRDEEHGIHYYTYRPEAASSAKWRAIEWDLQPPNE